MRKRNIERGFLGSGAAQGVRHFIDVHARLERAIRIANTQERFERGESETVVRIAAGPSARG
jgi:hypothetical protein